MRNFTALGTYFLFRNKFSWNEGIDTDLNVKSVLLCRNFDFLGGYSVVTARYVVVTTGYCPLPNGYCSLLAVTARYLVVTTGYCLLPGGYCSLPLVTPPSHF